ncbi:MAG: TIM barrel protein [Ginsengibacter sp.]
MNTTRRKFLKTAAAGMAVTALSGSLMSCFSGADSSGGTLKKFGIQLYTLRDILSADPKGILKQLAAMGYKQIESYEGNKGMFWGMKNTEFKKYMDDLGMEIVASHCSLDKNFERKVAEAGEIGISYLIDPWIGPQKTMEIFRKKADEFNRAGEICNKAGLKYAYHNHAYSFEPLEGAMPQDVLMQNTDHALVDFEMDIYWVHTAGEDPVKWLEKYPNRFRLCHIKDRIKNAPHNDENHSIAAGQGEIDFPKILKVAKKQGMKYFLIEQERYDHTTPIEAAEINAKYLKNLVF